VTKPKTPDARTVVPGQTVEYHNEPKVPRGAPGKRVPLVVKKTPVDAKAAAYMPTRGKIEDPLRSGADSILRAVEKGGAIQMATLVELCELLRTKTDYQFHIEVAVLPRRSAILQTIDNERDAQETIRRLKAKP
jgi:hypothetical protein